MNILERFGYEFRRALRNFKYERTENGSLLMPAQGILVHGEWANSLNGGEWAVDRNLVVNQGLDYLLDVALSSGSQLAAFFIAPFAANVAPAAGLTAATFTATQTEFTNYTQSTRPAWTEAGVTGQLINNNASPGLITVGSGTGVNNTTVWGAGLVSASGKSSTSGTLVSCVRFAAARTGLTENDELRFKYQIAASSA